MLEKFFDPKDGQVTQRLAMFVDDQGVLARLLEKYLAPRNSVLAQTLAQQVGETSPLFRKLSSTDSEGLVKVLEVQLRGVLNDGHAGLVRALDPLADNSAIARFLKSLHDELKGADEDRAKQLASALNALDANDQNSLINRLVRETNTARQAVLHAVNPDAPDSAMAIVKQTLITVLKEHSRSQTDLLKQQQERHERFETDIRDLLVRLEFRSEPMTRRARPRGWTSRTRSSSLSLTRYVVDRTSSKRLATLPASAQVQEGRSRRPLHAGERLCGRWRGVRGEARRVVHSAEGA